MKTGFFTKSWTVTDWAMRMLQEPESYVAEDDALLLERHWVGGDIRKPRKIFYNMSPASKSPQANVPPPGAVFAIT